MYFFFLCEQMNRDESLHTHIFILFRTAEKERPYSKEIYFPLPIFFVNVLFTYAMYFFFLHGQNAGTYPDTLEYSFFFVPPKKRGHIPRKYIPFAHFFVNVLFTYAMYFSFCAARKKSTKKKEAADQNSRSLASQRAY